MKTKLKDAPVKSSAKVVVSPEDAAVAMRIKEIQAMSSFEQVTALLMSLRTTVNDLMERQQELNSAKRVSDKMRTQSAAAQEYVAAQMHKESCDSKTAAIESLSQERARQTKLRDAAGERQKELFLSDPAQPHNCPETITVSLVKVVNPATSNYDSHAYLDSSTTIEISLDGKAFNDEAYLVSDWAAQHGFIVVSSSRDVTL